MTVCLLVLGLLLVTWHSGCTATTQDFQDSVLLQTAKYNDDQATRTQTALETSTENEHSSFSIKLQEPETLSSYYLELENGQLFIPRSKLLRLLRALERLKVENSALDLNDGNLHSVRKALEANSDDSHSGSTSLSDSVAIPPQAELNGTCNRQCFEVIRDLIHYGTSLPHEDMTTETFRDSDQRVELNDNEDEANPVLSLQKREAPLTTLSSPPPPPPVGENNRKSGPTIDEIISGIVQLLGGNVQVTKPNPGHRIRPTIPFRKPSSKRVNHRGPPKLSPTVTIFLPTVMTTATPQLSVPSEQYAISSSLSPEDNPASFTLNPSKISSQTVFPTISPISADIPASIKTTNDPQTNALPSSSNHLSHQPSKYTLIEVPAYTISTSKTSLQLSSDKSASTHTQVVSTAIPEPIVPSTISVYSNPASQVVISISTLPNKPNTDDVKPKGDEIVYGKPYNVVPPSNTTDTKVPSIQPSPPSPTPMAEVTITGTGSVPKKDQAQNSSNSSPTGRPYVIPVEIEEVRPYVGPFPPGQFPSGNQGNRKNRPPPGGQRYPGARPNSPANAPGETKNKNTPPLVRPPIRSKPNTPLVRIDTCIVGDDTTCDVQLNERCVTETGVSSCHCKPGFARSFARGPCIPVISVSMSLKVDRFGSQQLSGSPQFLDPNSDDHHLLEHEMKQALSSLFTYTSYSRSFMGSNLNRLYGVSNGVVMNATVHLEDNEANRHPGVLQRLLQQEVLNAITSRNLNIGDSSLFVDSPPNPGPLVEDVNECELSHGNDCSANGICQNTFGSFRCLCKPGYMDKFPDDLWKSGRACAACPPAYCNGHGECFVNEGRRECKCKGNYIGSRCEIDGEVLGVALGASLSALLIIILTLICLCVWNRRWKRSQPKSGLSLAGTYPRKTSDGRIGFFPRPTVEDRLRWAQITDAMGNVYVPAEGVPGGPPLPSIPPPASCPSAKHIYATPSRLLMQKMEDERARQYGQLRPKSRGPCPSGHQSASGYYDLNEYPIRENFGNLYTNPAPKSFYGFDK